MRMVIGRKLETLALIFQPDHTNSRIAVACSLPTVPRIVSTTKPYRVYARQY
jgi:hypothetical protein